MDIIDVFEQPAEGIESLKRGHDGLVRKAKDLAHSIPDDTALYCEDTEYGLPCAYVWNGAGTVRASDVDRLFSDAELKGVDELMRLGIESSMAFDVISAIEGTGIIPDSWLDSFGNGLIDGTVPGIALFTGEPKETYRKEILDCARNGLAVILSGGYSKADFGDRKFLRLYGPDALGINGLVARVAVRSGGVEPGNRASVSKYLKKKPKLIVIHTGELSILDVTVICSAAAVGAFTVSDSSVFPSVPRLSENVSENMAATAISRRGITFRKNGRVRSGSVFENERIRKNDTRLEFGGPDAPASYEIAVASENVTDGNVKLTGKDLPELDPGLHPLSIEVHISGDFDPIIEQAIERRIHFALSRTEGVWHSGQRDNMWLRVSNAAIENGLTFRELGDNIISDIKNNLKAVKIAIEIRFASDPATVSSGIQNAKKRYSVRDSETACLKDDSVDSFYTCTICQSYAPGHICIISPERSSVCGSVTWTDARVGSELNPEGPQRAFQKGVLLDAEKGEWSGVDDLINRTSMGSVRKICMHSVADSPMTACSCMEVAAVVSPDRRSIILLDRSDMGKNPSGYSFADVSDIVGSGRQVPGLMGMGKQYILSGSFLKGDGGLARVSWMNYRLKCVLGEPLHKAFTAAGGPELYGKIADENVAYDEASFERWLSEKDHPAMHMEPLIL